MHIHHARVNSFKHSFWPNSGPPRNVLGLFFYLKFYHDEGLIFDLIEILADQLKRNRLGTVPFYYIAPMSKDSLAHAQIYPEFLSVEKQNKAAAPEFPFTHDEAIENGRLKIFEHATEGLSEHFKGPAVIFTGHPSLELGQVKLSQ